MTKPARTLPLALITSLRGGDDVQVIEDIGDATEVYGDSLDLFPMVERFCENPDAPAGQCEFNAVGLEPDRCIYCRKTVNG